MLLIAACFVIIGAAVTVGIAWVSAAWPFVRSWTEAAGVRAFHGTDDAAGSILWIRTSRTWGASEATIMRFHDETLGFHMSYDPQQHAGWDTLAGVAPEWMISWANHHLLVDEHAQYDDAIIISCGFPLASMVRIVQRDTPDLTTALKRSASGGSDWPASVQLPYRPLWPGFAIDALLYGGVAAGAWFLPGVIRRGRRGRRCACMACGYPRAGLEARAMCPECGSRP